MSYAYASPFQGAACQLDAETLIYEEKDLRRRGIGKALCTALEEFLKEQHILNVNACIAGAPVEDAYLTNSSEVFHEWLGYFLVGEFTQCGYKFGRWYRWKNCWEIVRKILCRCRRRWMWGKETTSF